MSDTAPTKEATADELALALRDRLPKIVKDLRDVSESIIPDIIRCRDYLEAKDKHKEAARISLDLLPYVATKMKEVAELADRAMPVQLNITITTKDGALPTQEAARRLQLDKYHLTNGATLDFAAVEQLLTDYELVTGVAWQPRKTFTDSQQ